MDNREKYLRLREEFPCFEYRGFDYEIVNGDFIAVFHFVCGEHSFNPKHIFKQKSFYSFNHLDKERIELLLFNLGMIELVSYWKAFCSKKIRICGWSLTKEQLAFWRKIYFYGLGEFFFLNGIQTTLEGFVDFECEGERQMKPLSFDLQDCYIVPIGGGKDSVVSLDLLYGAGRDIRPFVINMRGATRDCCSVAGYAEEEVLEDKRSIDPHLLELNAQGFLNGHTPFSAMLAFTSLLTAAFSKRKHIALSNESSAEESTVAGEKINHQYSKSLEFENDFRSYVSEFISSDFNYFSFLRPLSELHIAKLFSHLQYEHVFKSCNAGSKQDIWCGNCPKCLFAFIILSPFLEKEVLCEIFGKNLFEDEKLSGYLLELCGIGEQKPFECVGTISEVNTAIAMRIVQNTPAKGEILLNEWLKLPLAAEYLQSVRTFGQEGQINPLFALSKDHNLLPRDVEIFSNAYLFAKKAQLRRILAKERIAILGFGREGQSTWKMLSAFGLNQNAIIADQNAETIKQNADLPIVPLEEKHFEGVTLYIKTPGISCKRIPFVPKERITSQTDLFLRLFASQTVGISGTKGKSTTSSLLYKILSDQTPNAILAGNIGVPLFDILESINEETVIVAELSAHQLQFIELSPHISILLNLYEEHLDHFNGFSDYCLAKFNLALRQRKGDFFIYNSEDNQTQSLLKANHTASERIGFSLSDYQYPKPQHLKGEHNLRNALAALSAAELLGLDKKKAIQSIETFEPLAHRLQFVATLRGVNYYNDSISTIPQATLAAIATLKNVRTLILGGMDRGIDYTPLVSSLPATTVRNIAFTGGAGRRIKSLLAEAGLNYNSIESDNYAEIVRWCAEQTPEGASCLLSPAASSYDSFRNFEHRGEVFAELVRNLPK